GGGGYGRAFDRDLADVERDLNRGYISREVAESVYGVVIAEAQTAKPGHARYTLDSQGSEARRQLCATRTQDDHP
ncbi:MAG: hypothetical protein JWQ88_420, partial [Rhodoferax sp.]|nr:hypothetical protein [Rhodoferax sp.]